MDADKDRKDRLAEIVEYTRNDLAVRDAAELAVTSADGSQHIHIHHHYPPAPAPVVHDTRPDVMARAFPYMMVIMGWLVIGFVIAVVLLMLTPSIMAIVGSMAGLLMALAIGFCAMAVCAVAVGASVRALRSSRTDRQIMDRRIRATGRR